MKANEFIKRHGVPAPSQPIKILLVDSGATDAKTAEAEAVFRLVTDKMQSEALCDAAKAGAPAAEEARVALEHAHLLHAILRDKDRPAEPFFDGADEVLAFLVPDERIRVLGVYQLWKEQQIPSEITKEQYQAMVEDAKHLFFGDLLTKYGYWPTRWALPSLARASIASLASRS